MNAPVPLSRLFWLLAPLLAWACPACFASAHAQDQLDRQHVYRLNPVTEQFVMTSADELQAGFLYRRFRPDLSRWVWSVYKGDGQFSFALGAGTTQPVLRLDPTLEDVRDVRQTLQQRYPRLADAIEDRALRIFVRLNSQDRWEVYGPFGVPSLFDQQTGRRWESHGGRYVPISHTNGYHWRYVDGRYEPAAAWSHDWSESDPTWSILTAS